MMKKSRSEWQNEIDEICFEASEAGEKYQSAVAQVNAALIEHAQAKSEVESAIAYVESIREAINDARNEDRAAVSSAKAALADAKRYLAEAQRRLKEAEVNLKEAEKAFKDTENRIDRMRSHLHGKLTTTQSELSRAESITIHDGPDRFSDHFHAVGHHRDEESSAFRSFVSQIEDAASSLEATVSRVGKPSYSQAKSCINGMGTSGAMGTSFLGGFGIVDFVKSMILRFAAPCISTTPSFSTSASFSLSTTGAFPMLGTVAQGGMHPCLSTPPQYSARLYSSDRVVLSPSGPSLLGFGTVPDISIRLSTPVNSINDTIYSPYSPSLCLASSSSFSGPFGASDFSCSLGSSGGSLGGGSDFGGGFGCDFGGGLSFGS